MSVQAHSNGLFLSFFFLRPLLCVHLISPFLLGIRVYNYYSFRCISKKDGAHSRRRRRPELVRAAGWLMSKRDISVYLFIYLFIYSFLKDSPCLASRSLVLYFLYSLCRVLFFGEENFNVRKQHFRNFHIKRKGPGCVLQLMRAA